MESILVTHAVPLFIIACLVSVASIVTVSIVVGKRMTELHVSKTLGLKVHTNDVAVRDSIVDEIIFIDSEAKRAIRKGTMTLNILSPKLHDTSTDMKLVNLKANLLLVYAAYEDHFTREISVDDGDLYLADKVQDVWELIKPSKEQFPELTYVNAESFVCHWLKNTVAPVILKACNRKVAYYGSQLKRKDISLTIKEGLEKLHEKNKKYIENIITLANREDISEKSTIFIQGTDE